MKNKSADLDEATYNLIESIVVLISIIVLFALVGFAYFFNEAHKSEDKTNDAEYAWACGTTSRSYRTRSIHDTTTIQYANFDLGKTLFRYNCATCHNKNMRDDLTGPALGGITERWGDYPIEDLYGFIRNSQGMIEAKHPRAILLWEEWKPTVMSSFEDLTDEEIENIIAYIEDHYQYAFY